MRVMLRAFSGIVGKPSHILRGLALLVILLPMTAGACNKAPDVEDMPIGSDVQLTRRDGALVEGKLKARDANEVKVEDGPVTRSIPRVDIADARIIDSSAKPTEPPPAAKFREYTIPEGSTLTLKLATAVNTATNRAEDPVEATLQAPVAITGVEVLPVGAQVRGILTSVEAAGKVKGRASLAMQFREVAAHGDTYPVDARFGITAPSTKQKDAIKVGVPAAGGAILGAILGGKKGAAIGAGVGGGAGAAAVLMTPGKELVLPPGTTVSARLDHAVDVKVPLRGATRFGEDTQSSLPRTPSGDNPN